MEQKDQTSKYLSWLLYIGIASISLNVVKDILVNDSCASWLQFVLTGGAALCLYLLTPAGSGYRLASIIQVARLLLNIAIQAVGSFLIPQFLFSDTMEKTQMLTLLMNVTRVLGIAAAILSILSLWLEYRAHGALVSGTNRDFQRKWTHLFFISLGAALFYSAGTYVAAYFQQLLQWDIATTHGLVLAILNLPVKAAYLLYLLYLYRTIRLVRESINTEETYGP